MSDPRPNVVLPVGTNLVRLWGLTARERLARIAAAQDLSFGSGPREGPLMANLSYAFDPEWLTFVGSRPDHVVTKDGVPVVANVGTFEARTWIALAMKEGRRLKDGGALTIVKWEDGERRLHMGPLTEDGVAALERASLAGVWGAESGMIGDGLWRRPVLALAGLVARIGGGGKAAAPAGAMLCTLAAWFMIRGEYWIGLLPAFAFLLLMQVDRVTERLTLSGTRLSRAARTAVDMIGAPLLYWAWVEGLPAYGRPLTAQVGWAALAVLVGGHVAQRLLQSRLAAHRLSGPGPNLLILLVSLVAGRPDLGLLAIGGWTTAAVAVQAVRVLTAKSPVEDKI